MYPARILQLIHYQTTLQLKLGDKSIHEFIYPVLTSKEFDNMCEEGTVS